MKRLKNKLVATTLLLASIFLFSSCDSDDYEWRRGKLLYEAEVQLPDRIDIDFYSVEITSGGRYDRIDEIAYRLGEIEVYGGSYIKGLSLQLMNYNDVYLDLAIESNRGGVFYDNDTRVRNFLMAIVDAMNRDGYARIRIDGVANSRWVDIDFNIDVDAYVRY